MNNENYISEEAFEELVNGLDFIGSFTLYGRENLKYHIKRLQEENQQLKQQLEQRDNIINKTREKCKNKGKMDYDVWLYLSEIIKTLEGFSKHIDYNLHPIITEAYKCEVRNCINELCEVVKYKLIYKDELLEILDKGDE